LRLVVQLSASPDAAPSPPRRFYRPVVRAGDWLICSGQICTDGGVLVGGGVADQLTQALVNLASLLESEGSSLDAVAKTTVFLVDMGEYAAMNEAYAAAFGDHLPARSVVAVTALPMGAAIEIEAWAYQPVVGA
jgi:2-iminobutanoate/2-iminopropanoate deaminase